MHSCSGEFILTIIIVNVNVIISHFVLFLSPLLWYLWHIHISSCISELQVFFFCRDQTVWSYLKLHPKWGCNDSSPPLPLPLPLSDSVLPFFTFHHSLSGSAHWTWRNYSKRQFMTTTQTVLHKEQHGWCVLRCSHSMKEETHKRRDGHRSWTFTYRVMGKMLSSHQTACTCSGGGSAPALLSF